MAEEGKPENLRAFITRMNDRAEDLARRWTRACRSADRMIKHRVELGLRLDEVVQRSQERLDATDEVLRRAYRLL